MWAVHEEKTLQGFTHVQKWDALQFWSVGISDQSLHSAWMWCLNCRCRLLLFWWVGGWVPAPPTWVVIGTADSWSEQPCVCRLRFGPGPTLTAHTVRGLYAITAKQEQLWRKIWSRHHRLSEQTHLVSMFYIPRPLKPLSQVRHVGRMLSLCSGVIDRASPSLTNY